MNKSMLATVVTLAGILLFSTPSKAQGICQMWQVYDTTTTPPLYFGFCKSLNPSVA